MHLQIASAIELTDGVNEGLLLAGQHAFGIADIVDGVAGGIELDSLVATGKETGGPLARGNGLRITTANAGQHNESGQIFRVGA